MAQEAVEAVTALPAGPFGPAGESGSGPPPVRIQFHGGRRRDGHLVALDLELGRARVDEGGATRTYGVAEIDHILFTTPIRPGSSRSPPTEVPFEIGLTDGRTMRGHAVGAVRARGGLTLFVRRADAFHRVFVPATSIVSERVGAFPEVPAGQGADAEAATSADAPAPAEPPEPAGTPDGEEAARALAERLGLPYLAPDALTPEPGALELIPDDLARDCLALPLGVHDGHLRVAVADPMGSESLSLLQFAAGMRLEVLVASEAALRQRIRDWHTSADERAALLDLGGSQAEPGREAWRAEAEQLAQQKPIVRLVANMVTDAAKRRASDIHIRPGEDHVDVLYRIDGMLVPIQRLGRALLPAVVSRIKVLARMDIAERRAPQDGHCDARVAGRRIDMRISVIPTVEGESVVIRLLDTTVGIRAIDELGLSREDTERFQDLVNHNHGILLVTGPTGSGKSTTLYAALTETRKRPVNIVTVEDPVEYHIDGVQQIQVLRAAGLTFARALRNILRHDPDVIMVGEIRDQETAGIAMESALTGHLVLSTLHTNSAAGTITRLLEMGVRDYLIRSTLLGVLAQRLVRRNCPHCLGEEAVTPHVRRLLDVGDEETFRRGRGCDRCNQTGFSGRLVAYELMGMNERLRAAVTPDCDEASLQRLAREHGMVPLAEHALALARSGRIPLEEAYRLRVD